MSYAERKNSGEYLKCSRKTKPPSWERDPAGVIGRQVQRPPSGYRRAGEASPRLRSRMQTDRWRRGLKNHEADSAFSRNVLLTLFLNPCVSSFDGVSSRLAVPACARLCGGARRSQPKSQSSTRPLNHPASGRNAGHPTGEEHFSISWF